MKVPKHCFQQLAVATFTTIGFYVNSVSAQIVPDTTLPNNSSITQLNNIKVIEGGTEAGSNLFHSFKQFSLPTGSTAYFNNSRDIQSIITRVTGNNISNIDGILRTNGTADLFLINPNGIIFGENASLDIGGSFLATTANSINFADGTEFSATEPETTPLLTISVPVGLQFGATPAPIINQSQASPNGATNFSRGQPVGLQVPVGETLALIGGDVILEGGNLTADSGRIELGSVGSNSVISLNSIDQGWTLGYEGVENFGNIQLIERISDGLNIGSQLDVSGEDGGGTIQVQGDSVELIGQNVKVNSITRGGTDAGNIMINGRKLVVRDGAQVSAFTLGQGSAGNIIVNASDSVELIGTVDFSSSALSSNNYGDGKGGSITINTSRLLIRDGAAISVNTSGRSDKSQFILATGEGGDLIINASELVEVVGKSALGNGSTITSGTRNSAHAGDLTISTKELIVRDGGEIRLGSTFFKPPRGFTVVGDTSTLGDAGNLDITAESIVLDNQGGITSETETGNGGNINLQIQDLLVMLDNSQISTSAGTALLQGDGGNITINISEGFIVADANENSDITANAFTGSGGNVNINVFSIYGMEPLSRDELVELLGTDNPSELNPQSLPTSNITAISQQNPNLNGELNINATDTEPTKGLTEIPEIPIDGRMSENCKPNKDRSIDQFIYVGQGGIRPLPGDERVLDFVLDAGWIELEETKGVGKQGTRGQGDKGTRGQGDKETREKGEKGKRGRFLVENRIAEATHWVVDENGDIFFVAGQPDDSSNKFNEVGCKG